MSAQKVFYLKTYIAKKKLTLSNNWEISSSCESNNQKDRSVIGVIEEKLLVDGIFPFPLLEVLCVQCTAWLMSQIWVF